MSKRWFGLFCSLLLAITMTACNTQSESASWEESNTSEHSVSASSEIEDFSEPSSSQRETSSSSSEPDQARLDYLNTLNLDSAPVDLNDLEAVTRAYLKPLVPTGDIWFYSWKTASEIKAMDLINICSYNNFLNLPRDFELCYPDEYRYASANQVETSIIKHFNVSNDYLETAPQFNPQDGTYELIGGFGGMCGPLAMSAEQSENQIKIRVGIITSFTEEDFNQMEKEGNSIPAGVRSSKRIIMPDESILVPAGTLTIELGENNIVKYQSYQLDKDFKW